ncbi:MAG: hypothetical protein IJN25_09705 [Clostridia bacterium]|nr:hypothetical protein [Clostridia bacterium]
MKKFLIIILCCLMFILGLTASIFYRGVTADKIDYPSEILERRASDRMAIESSDDSILVPSLAEIYTAEEYAQAEDFARHMFRRMQYYSYFILIPKCYEIQTDSFYLDIYTFDKRHFEFITIMGSKQVEGSSVSYQFEIKEK